LIPTTHEPTTVTKPQRRNPRGWPPRPACEDEIDALAKEHLGADIKASHLASNEPPFRGTVDQHPIILESTVSTADAAKLHDKLHAECQAEDSGERRFVLIPRGDTHSPIRDDEEAPRRSYTEPTDKPTQPTQNDTLKRNLGKTEGSAPPLERRRSRQDLPSLQTEIPPPYKRSSSAYAYTPAPIQSTRSPRASGDFLLSPDAASFRGQSKSGYFDLPPKIGPHLSQGNIATGVAEKRRSGGSTSRPTTPTTPVLENRHSADSGTYPRMKQDGDKLTRPQQLSADSGIRRSDRAPSAHSHLDPSEHAGHRKGSRQSTRKYYSDSDDDQDSSDSDRRRRGHRHHHRHHTQNSLHPDDDRDRHHRSVSKSTRSSDGKPGSKISSPLASPDISPSQLPPSYSSNRDSRRPNSRPVSPLSGYTDAPPDSGRSRPRSPVRSRRSSPVAPPGTRTASSTLPIPIPARVDLYSPGEARHSPSIPKYDDDHRRASTRPTPSPRPSPKPSPKPSWQPPSFQPPSESTHLERPVGSYRRYSQDVDDGNIAPLPPCPRTTLSRGHNDWLTLPRCPTFNICPSCYESTMAPTEFHAHFVAAPAKPPHEEVLCDFGSQPWYRIAWLLTRKEQRRDLTLMSSLANIADTTPPCMGKYEAVRKWYSIIDPNTGHSIRNFDVCLACVKSIETLLPQLKGIFVRTDHKYPPDLPRVCDMRFDSKRFIHYFDALETAADTATNLRYPPDTTDLTSLVKRFASLPECPRDTTLSNAYWHIITQLPDFTICPECFDEVVLPGLDKGKAIPVMFNKAMQHKEAASCQLYSERMRRIFEKAVDGNDYKLLATKARERKAKEVQCKKELAEWKGVKGGEKEIRRIEGDWEKWE
jgi:hypothetical protein